ncbi:MAG TPA: hypothetical protein P5254_12470 [Aquihabitans sp.]|nr:hypothetical protein [Aquihabitans sp.]
MTEADNTPKRLPNMDRRGFVGAAAIGVGAAWAAPAVISMPASGSANLVNSPPPTSTTTTTTGSSTTTSTSTTSTSTTSTSTPTTSSTTTTTSGFTTTTDDGQLPATTEQGFPGGGGGGGGGGTGGEGLPRTGFDVQDPLTLAFGLIAAGGAMQVWSAQRARLEATALPVVAAEGDAPPA